MIRCLLLAGIAATALSAAPAHAADDIDLSVVVRTACAGIKDAAAEKPVPLFRIAEAILYAAGYPPSQLLGDGALTRDQYAARVIATVTDPPASIDPATRRAIGRYLLKLGQDMGPGSNVTAKARGLRVTSPFPADTGDRAWIFHTNASLVCMPGKLPPATVVAELKADAPPRFGLVKKVEDLALTGDDRKKADSATIGLKRERTENDDGTDKLTTTLTFDGTFGLRLTPDTASTPIFAFANYTLSRNRTKPAAELKAGERRDDKDTNGLALGIKTDDLPLRGIPVMIGGQLSFVSDYVKDSRRGVGGILVTPGWRKPLDLGLCSFGALKTIAIGSIAFRTQCVVAGELDYSHVFMVGRADFADHGDFLSAGFVVGIDLAPPLLEKNGIVSSLRYRYLPTVTGKAPDVKRIEASLKYRWWLVDATAIDFGLTYKRGEEFKTYTDEDSLELSFGVIF